MPKYTTENLIQDRITFENYMLNALISSLDKRINDNCSDKSDEFDFTYSHVFEIDKLKAFQTLREHFILLLSDNNNVSDDVIKNTGTHQVNFFDDLSDGMMITLGFEIDRLMLNHGSHKCQE